MVQGLRTRQSTLALPPLSRRFVRMTLRSMALRNLIRRDDYWHDTYKIHRLSIHWLKLSKSRADYTRSLSYRMTMNQMSAADTKQEYTKLSSRDVSSQGPDWRSQGTQPSCPRPRSSVDCHFPIPLRHEFEATDSYSFRAAGSMRLS